MTGLENVNQRDIFHRTPRLIGLALMVSATIALLGCPPPQQRWMAGMNTGPGVITPADEDVRASRQRLEDLRREREAAGIGRDYHIGPGDLVEINVFDTEDLDRTVRVSGAGYVTLPLIGAIKADGLTERELEADITQHLEAKFIRNPQVNVFVQDYGSQKVSVMGAVLRPGQYSLTKDKNTILDMLSEAGGLARDAGSRIYLLPGERIDHAKIAMLASAERLGVGDRAVVSDALDASSDPIVIDVRDILDAGTQTALTLPSRAGDVIVVPEGGQFLVDGWVEKPGSYPLTRGVSVLGAVTAAGGPLYPAATSEVQVVRTQRNGTRMTLSADLKGIMDGRGQDIPLEAGDIVYVPANALKVPLYALYYVVTNVFRVAGTIPIL
ncbi:MAG: polysaccharide biosynthesis/export family protein [Deltaproteobacteria bacterium]|nr:polysaccharide biosynthesis/export family protein [Deltaproteobacteria bacterium]MBI3390220.1 polysaccharide biosynthesis/export family protein [Deltaproteobacteria bacterium]